MNGNLTLIIEDAKKLANAVFSVYPDVLRNYSTLIGPVSTPEQQKILFDLCVACIGISNKESRVAAWKEERKNGNGNGHSNGNNGNGENGYKQRDIRDRSIEQLIKELNIKSPAQAGFLRARKEISYMEWKAVHDHLCQKEIDGASGFSSP